MFMPRSSLKLKVVNPRNDTVSREVLRHKEFEGLVELGRVRDFFICGSLSLKSELGTEWNQTKWNPKAHIHQKNSFQKLYPSSGIK
jgi:hypothetical protein